MFSLERCSFSYFQRPRYSNKYPLDVSPASGNAQNVDSVTINKDAIVEYKLAL
jgi:hypothetical protein